MKGWKSFGFGVLSAGLVGMATYTLMNKNTKKSADRLINNALDKVNASNMMR